jgi:hypothetical protein
MAVTFSKGKLSLLDAQGKPVRDALLSEVK